jgi:hypothetical protein
MTSAQSASTQYSIHTKVSHKICAYTECYITPLFNLPGETGGMYCSEHGRPLGMVNVISKKCRGAEGGCPCKKSPSFNAAGETRALYCKVHKTPDMINVSKKTCRHATCDKTPYFNMPDRTWGMYCGVHGKPMGMINVVSRRCRHEGDEKCDRVALYKMPGQKSMMYCSRHKLDGMVAANASIPAKPKPKAAVARTPKCSHKNCDTTEPAKYYFRTCERKRYYCAHHFRKLHGNMIDKAKTAKTDAINAAKYAHNNDMKQLENIRTSKIEAINKWFDNRAGIANKTRDTRVDQANRVYKTQIAKTSWAQLNNKCTEDISITPSAVTTAAMAAVAEAAAAAATSSNTTNV